MRGIRVFSARVSTSSRINIDPELAVELFMFEPDTSGADQDRDVPETEE